jgi:hypothetical protein
MVGERTASVSAGIEGEPSITVHPLSQTVCEGSAVTFDVEDEGTMPVYYQWIKDGEVIPGASSKRYTIFDVSPEQAGEYKVIASNFYGSTESDAAILRVEKPPLFAIAEPFYQTAFSGQSITFKVTATASGPLSYQWEKDGQAIPGANSATYTIDDISKKDEGCYGAIVENSYCSAKSNLATLNVVEGN